MFPDALLIAVLEHCKNDWPIRIVCGRRREVLVL